MEHKSQGEKRKVTQTPESGRFFAALQSFLSNTQKLHLICILSTHTDTLSLTISTLAPFCHLTELRTDRGDFIIH